MEQADVPKEIFTFPNLEKEEGEIERVAKECTDEDPAEFTKRFLDLARQTKLVELSGEVWAALNNTHSQQVEKDTWDTVAHYGRIEGRDWQSLKEKIEHGAPLDAPIILKNNSGFHLVSGDTRLMVAKAMGLTPKVLIVDLSSELL